MSVSDHFALANEVSWNWAIFGRCVASYNSSAGATSAVVASADCNASESSNANIVPKPWEKCVVWAASPMSTMFRCQSLAHETFGNFDQRTPSPNADAPHFKDSSRRYLDRADAIIAVSTGHAVWKGIGGSLWRGKPQFTVSPPDYSSPELAKLIVVYSAQSPGYAFPE